MVLNNLICYTITAALLFTTQILRADQHSKKVRIYNTVKQKLLNGESVVGGTVYTNDPNIYCAMANSGFDFLWIEMQHSPLMYNEVARMIWACRDAPAIPFIRVPDATESDLQKATDIGALGIVVPMVDTVEETKRAVLYSKYPPLGRRSRGGGQYGALWGGDYRETANDNIMLVIMLETPVAIANAAKIAAVPGVDVVFSASGDIASFTGYERSDRRYKALIKKIHDNVLGAGKILGGPYSWKDRPGYTFFQGPSESVLIKSGTTVTLGNAQTAEKNEDVATGDEAQ
jgi:2-keto-3-deoxy-L-rhamnonate aldolase RhmA